MNNQEPESRVRRYDFNQDNLNQDALKTKQFRVWPWIVLLIIIVAVLVGGIKWLNYAHTSPTNPATMSRKMNATSKKNKSTKVSKKIEQPKGKQKVQQSKAQPATAKSNDDFSNSRQFGSVQDAQAWAKATQQSWLNAGYNNYTISSDGQGYYVLKFTR